MDTFTNVIYACAGICVCVLLACFSVFVTVETYSCVVKTLAGM